MPLVICNHLIGLITEKATRKRITFPHHYYVPLKTVNEVNPDSLLTVKHSHVQSTGSVNLRELETVDLSVKLQLVYIFDFSHNKCYFAY